MHNSGSRDRSDNDVANIAALVGRTAGRCVVWARWRLSAKCSCAALLRLIIELPYLSDTDEKLGAIDRAFTATFRAPLAVFTPLPAGISVRYHSASFVPDHL